MRNIFNYKINSKVTFLVCLLLLILVYTAIFLWHTPNLTSATPLAYYNLLLDSFFKGRLDVTPLVTADLSLYNSKWYLNWGPWPVLFILPLYLLSGVNASDSIYTFLAGIFNIILFPILVDEFSKFFKLKLSIYSKIFIWFSFALSSPNFYLSSWIAIWSSSQIISVFYLLICLIFYFKYLNNLKVKDFIFSIFFFNLAWGSRITLFLYFMIFGYVFLFLYRHRYLTKLKQTLLLFISISLIFIITYGTYNYLRFGNPFENGMKYHNVDSRYKKSVEKEGTFSLAYLPKNLYHYLFNHIKFSAQTLIIKDPGGNSIFSSYPATLLIFPLILMYFKKKFNRNISSFLLVSAVCILLNLTLLFLLFATGGYHPGAFGSRYFFDVTPLVFLLICFVTNNLSKYIGLAILIYGFFVNLVGILT